MSPLKNVRAALAASLLALLPWHARAAPASLDLRFSNGGVYVTQAAGRHEDLAIDAAGSIIVMHASNCAGEPGACGRLTRLLPDGTPAVPAEAAVFTGAFGSDTEFLLQGDEKVLLLTYVLPTGTLWPNLGGLDLRRYDRRTGEVDPSFTTESIRYSQGGRPPDWMFRLQLLPYPGGKFIFNGRRYLENGALDVDSPAWDSVALPSGAWFSTNSGDIVQRRNANGQPDPLFGSGGTRVIDTGYTTTRVQRLGVQPDGKVLVAGYAYNYYEPGNIKWFLQRLLPNGTDDPTFGSNGRIFFPDFAVGELAGIAVQPNGRILLAGNTSSAQTAAKAFVYGLNPDGSVDPSWGDPYFGPGNAWVGAMKLHPDGGVVLAGAIGSSPAVMKLIGDNNRSIAALPLAGVGRPYNAPLQGLGGTPPYSFSLESGTLPPGLALGSGAIAGTATTAGTYPFRLRMVDAGGVAHSQEVALTVHSSASLVSSYYGSILGRSPDASGQSHWEGEVTRLASGGANVSEVFYAMAAAFFGSSEYAGLSTSNTQFLTDLYRTFFGREPDPSGIAYWSAELAAGKPRGAVLNDFLFSGEFAGSMQSIFGSAATNRPEVSMVLDFYRGLLGRLPDGGGLQYWVGRFRAAQCNGTVGSEADAVSSFFINSAEYANRQAALPMGQRATAYVIELYNAFLKRGGDRAGVQYWVDQVTNGAQTGDQLRRSFRDSPEFQGRVNAVLAAGCAQ